MPPCLAAVSMFALAMPGRTHISYATCDKDQQES